MAPIRGSVGWVVLVHLCRIVHELGSGRVFVAGVGGFYVMPLTGGALQARTRRCSAAVGPTLAGQTQVQIGAAIGEATQDGASTRADVKT